jgi:HNH endonuclease
LQVHHVIRPEDGGRDELGNLLTLCAACHRLQHKAAGKRFPASARGVVRRRNFSPHPPGVEFPSPIDESFEDDPEAGAERNALQVVATLVRLALRAKLSRLICLRVQRQRRRALEPTLNQ